MIHKRHSPHPSKTIVTFEIPDTIWAERINLVGDFNDWDTTSLPFRRSREGNWQIELHLDSGLEYRFGYLLDGIHWRYDWHADKYAPNSQGGFDTIVVAAVPLSPTASEMPHHSAAACQASALYY
jgi:1,4-alpha-glucan branching enzyme